MKNDEKVEARELYFQTGLTKTEIAAKVGVNRRTVLLWCKQDEWEKIRQSSRTMPSLIAEKIYYLLDAFLIECLHTPGWTQARHKDAQTIYLLTSAIKKLKNRSTVNESMEMFNYFLEGVKKHKPDLAAEIEPWMDQYIAERTEAKVLDHSLDGINEHGAMEYQSDKEVEEEYQDKADLAEFEEELKRANGNHAQALENWQQKPPADIRPWAVRNPQPPTTNQSTENTTT